MREYFGEAGTWVLTVAYGELGALLCLDCDGLDLVQLLGREVAAVVVTALAYAGAAGDAREVEIWRRTSPNSDSEDNMMLMLVEQVQPRQLQCNEQ